MINRQSIAEIKDRVILINTARGGLINDAEVARALNNGKIAAAGIDVATTEPIAADSPLLTAKNCYITPYIAWAPRETRARLLEIAVANLEAFLNGPKEKWSTKNLQQKTASQLWCRFYVNAYLI